MVVLTGMLCQRGLAEPPVVLATASALESTLPGVAEPVQYVHLTPRLEGVLKTVLVTDGQQVQAGQILAELDAEIAEATVDVARAMAESHSEIRMAETHWQQSQRLVERVKQAHGDGASSDLELDQAVSAAEQASFRLLLAQEQNRQANAQLQLEIAKLHSHRLVAPFDGRILRIKARPGQSVARTDELMTLASLKQLQVDLHLPTAWTARLTPGEKYALSAGPPASRVITATLTAIEPHIDPASQTSRCHFLIENLDETLPSGLTVHLTSLDPVTSNPSVQ